MIQLQDWKKDSALEMRDLNEFIRLGISRGQRETSSVANIAQVDYVIPWLSELRDYYFHGQ